VSRPARPKAGEKEYNMAQISINNGHSYTTPEDALREYNMDTIAHYMDDDIREAVHAEIAPCTELEFLAAYLERATDDLIIG
jgi:hypothetical protein